VDKGNTEIISNNLMQFLEKKNVCVSLINAVGSEDIVVNTGIHSGVIRQLETPLQWLI
jgi:hypothetical protein